MKVKPTAWFALAAGCLFLHGAAWGIEGTDVIRRMQEKFGGLSTLSARFERSHYLKLWDEKQKVKGQLYVQRPDRFRFETRVQTVVTDGETAWNYAPADSQVVISRYDVVKNDRSYEKLLFDLILFGGYSGRYSPRYAGEERVNRKACHLVELRARQSETYISQIRLWVDRKQWVVRRVEYRNINNDVTTYTLSDLKLNKKLKADLFVLEPPEGIEIIDLR